MRCQFAVVLGGEHLGLGARLRADMEGQLHGRQKGWLLTRPTLRTRMILK